MKRLTCVFALIIFIGCSAPEPMQYQVFNINKFRQIRKNPGKHVGRLYAFVGRAANTEQTRQNVSFHFFVQDRFADLAESVSSDGPLVVVYPAPDTTIADTHQVKVLGYISELNVGDNVFGKKVGSFKLNAVAMYDDFTKYPFYLPGYEDIFEKWKTGDPVLESLP